MKHMNTEWVGPVPKQCDICELPLTVQFMDCAVPGPEYRGIWGCLCPQCFSKFNCALGLGRGQAYTKQPDGRWLKM